ncbi:MAG: potassium channel family protein [Ilumatobacter sp.]|uniref:potassium channel family protein n=1 Tax=Ilumatobacter sp. TaxID=1967498 RepID=UPI002615F751|nr:potassium channel family protein [Ilumatobacter sp.]MDJ0768942.1 potassium channel family protein [Ilumatobacter sp.]
MIELVAVVLGVAMILVALADLVNTLISTMTSAWRWWPSRVIGRSTFVVIRGIARRMDEESTARERLLSIFGSLLIIELLFAWALLQVFGFGLVWWGLGDIPSIGGLADAWYYSGVVFFTVGFGEIVPGEIVPRAGAILEAFFGVITMALVIGYLPSLYGAYSDRERMLMTLDAGTSDRITPTALVKAWAPDADPRKIDAQFERWELWAAGILETHSTVPLLALFRSHDRHQNWVTALGLLCDAALHAQIIVGSTDGNAYWFLRRAEAIFREVTKGADLTPYVEAFDAQDNTDLFRDLYDDLTAHGFQLRPFDDAMEYARTTRRSFGPAMEHLIDDLACPHGFWSTHGSIERWSAHHDLGAVQPPR